MAPLRLSFLTLAMLLTASGTLWASESSYSAEQWRDLGFRAMNFAVFAGVLFYLLRKPVVKFFKDRQENIARTLEYLQTQARNLEEKNEIMNKQIANIASEREAIIAQYDRMGQKERDRIIAEAQAAANQIVQKTQTAMDQEIKAARQKLMAEIVGEASKMAAELIKSGIDANDQKRLTAEFMKQVEELKPAKH